MAEVEADAGADSSADGQDLSSSSPETPLLLENVQSDCESDGRPTKFRTLNEIYETTAEVELDSDQEALLVGMEEPTCYREAAGDVNWEAAMESELNSTIKNRTWELLKFPPNHRPIGLKWVFKLKKNAKEKW